MVNEQLGDSLGPFPRKGGQSLATSLLVPSLALSLRGGRLGASVSFPSSGAALPGLPAASHLGLLVPQPPYEESRVRIVRAIAQKRKPKFRVVTSLVQGDTTCKTLSWTQGLEARLASGQLCVEGRSVQRRRPAGCPPGLRPWLCCHLTVEPSCLTCLCPHFISYKDRCSLFPGAAGKLRGNTLGRTGRSARMCAPGAMRGSSGQTDSLTRLASLEQRENPLPSLLLPLPSAPRPHPT